MKLFLKFCIGIAFLSISSIAKSQDKVEGIWFNKEKTGKIQIYKNVNGLFFGKIVWLKDPLNAGKARSDVNNPKKELQNRPLIGLVNLQSLKKTDENTYEDGDIYDPNTGKTYSCKMTLKNSNTLNVRGYIGFSMIGKTTVFTRTK